MTETIEKVATQLSDAGIELYATGNMIWLHGIPSPDKGESARVFAFDHGGNLTLNIADMLIRPEDFVALFTGPDTCSERRAEGLFCKAEGLFCGANRPLYLCECGAFCTDYTDATTYHKPRYCPNCGRKVGE